MAASNVLFLSTKVHLQETGDKNSNIKLVLMPLKKPWKGDGIAFVWGHVPIILAHENLNTV